MNKSLGIHILAEYYNCDRNILSNHLIIENYMMKATIKTKATIVNSCFHKFNPWGVSGAVIIKESHITIHTWAEYRYAAVDLFTCGDILNSKEGFKYLKRALKSKNTYFKIINRGKYYKVKSLFYK